MKNHGEKIKKGVGTETKIKKSLADKTSQVVTYSGDDHINYTWASGYRKQVLF